MLTPSELYQAQMEAQLINYGIHLSDQMPPETQMDCIVLVCTF